MFDVFIAHDIDCDLHLLFNSSSGSDSRDALWIFPNGTVTFYIKMSSCLYLPSMTKTVEPTSPSCIIIEPDGNVTGYMQSTISRICVSSKFFMKSLSSMAVLISSRDLEKKRQSLLSFSLSLFLLYWKSQYFLQESENITKEYK